MKVWAESVCNMVTGFSGGPFGGWQWNFLSHKRWKICWPADGMLASQEDIRLLD